MLQAVVAAGAVLRGEMLVDYEAVVLRGQIPCTSVAVLDGGHCPDAVGSLIDGDRRQRLSEDEPIRLHVVLQHTPNVLEGVVA